MQSSVKRRTAMRPLTILHTEWSDGWGGQEIRIVDECRGVAARGHRVLLAARQQCRILAKAHEAGLETFTLPMTGAFDLRSARRLRALLRTERVDILNTHSSVDSWIGALATRFRKVKLVRTRHLSSAVPSHPFNIIYRLPDAVVTTGESIRQQLIAGRQIAPARAISIPTGVDIEHFAPRPADPATKRSLGLPDNCRLVTIVAVLRRFKRHDLFLQAAGKLRADFPDARFLLVGEGPRRNYIEAAIVDFKLTDRVVLAGHCDDVRPFLAASNVIVLSSDSGEGVPQSITQALAMARPVVATNVGSVNELIQNEVTGLLVPILDVDALAAGIARFLRQPDFAAACGQRGRQHIVENFSRERMIDRTLELYARLTG